MRSTEPQWVSIRSYIKNIVKKQQETKNDNEHSIPVEVVASSAIVVAIKIVVGESTAIRVKAERWVVWHSDKTDEW